MRNLPQPPACRPRNASAHTLLRDAAHAAFAQRSRIHRRAPDVCRCIATGAAGLLWRSHRVLLISEICSQQQVAAADEQQLLLQRACRSACMLVPAHPRMREEMMQRGARARRWHYSRRMQRQEAGDNARLPFVIVEKMNSFLQRHVFGSLTQRRQQWRRRRRRRRRRHPVAVASQSAERACAEPACR